MSRRRTSPGPGGDGAAAVRKHGGANPPTRPIDSTEDGIRVLCVDDHPVIAEGLRAQFDIARGVRLVGRLRTAERLIPEVARLRPHAVLLDIEMPGPDAFEAADRLRRGHPEVRIIVLSAHIRDSYISAAFKAGASGYFAKSDDLEEIVAGIREAATSPGGAFVLGPRVRERCRPLYAHPAKRAGEPDPENGSAGPISERAATALESLTAREAEILRLIGGGLSRVQIAAQLSRSVKTIDGHQDRVMKKLGMDTRADLMRFAIREGLAEA